MKKQLIETLGDRKEAKVIAETEVIAEAAKWQG